MTTFRVTQRHRCALSVRGNLAPNAESARLPNRLVRLALSTRAASSVRTLMAKIRHLIDIRFKYKI